MNSPRSAWSFIEQVLELIVDEIKNIDRLCHSGWGGSYSARTEALNEARTRLLEALPKAKEVRDRINQHLASL
jgi:hypothetical protein